MKLAQELKEPAFAPREVLAGKDARQPVRALLAMTPEELSVSFKGSPMKRAKLRGLKRNALVALRNVRTASQMEKVRTCRCSLAHSMIPSRSCVSTPLRTPARQEGSIPRRTSQVVARTFVWLG